MECEIEIMLLESMSMIMSKCVGGRGIRVIKSSSQTYLKDTLLSWVPILIPKARGKPEMHKATFCHVHIIWIAQSYKEERRGGSILRGVVARRGSGRGGEIRT